MRRILLVDDSGEVRRSVRAVLEDLLPNTICGEAAGARDALSAVGRERWDLVLLDLSLPDCSGLDLLRDLRRLCPAVPVVVMSFHPEAEYSAAAEAAGAAGYVAKGSSPEVIAGACAAALVR